MEEEKDPNLNVARHCARCGAVRYVSIEVTSDEGSLCQTCRTGSVAAVPAAPRKSIFSRSESGASPAIAAALRDSLRSKSASGSKVDVEPLEADAPNDETVEAPQTDGFEIVRAGTVAPTFTAEDDGPNLRLIVPALVVLLTVMLGLGAFLTRERAQIPDTPAGHQLEWLLTALNDSDSATPAIIQERFSPWAIDEFGSRAIIGEIRAWDQRHAEYRVGRVVDDTRFRLIVLITTEAMEWGELVLEVEPQSPHEIRRFTIGPADPPR